MTNPKKETISVNDIESLEFELEKNAKKSSKKGYIDNKSLYNEFVVYHEKKMKWIEDGKEGRPPLTEKIGQAILDIATRRCYSRNFVGYTQSWKEEMIGDAIETCVKYCHNFNPEKYNNPFAYITQLVTNAIILRIKREKKQVYIKHKSFDLCGGFSAVLDENFNEEDVAAMAETNEIYMDHLRHIAEFEEKNGMNKIKPAKIEQEDDGILSFLEEI